MSRNYIYNTNSGSLGVTNQHINVKILASPRSSMPLQAALQYSPIHVSSYSASKDSHLDYFQYKPRRRIDYTAYLPAEILVAIFAQCFKYSLEHTVDSQPLSSRWAPLLMCGVCRRWREVTMCAPILWSSIEVAPSLPGTPNLRLVDICLQRSHHCPLSLELTPLVNKVRQADERYFEGVFRLYLSQMYRWRRVSLNMRDFLVKPMECIVGSAAPMLETLIVKTIFCSQESATRIVSLFPYMPNLKVINWHSLVPGIPPALPWAQLTHMHLSAPMGVQDCISYLSQCYLVKEATFDDLNGPYIPSLESSPPVLLPRLTKLSIQSFGGGSAAIFGHFTCPSLRYLEIKHKKLSTEARDINYFAGFFERSACRIHSFQFLDSHLPEQELIRFLKIRSLKNVMKLEVGAFSVTPKICHNLQQLNGYPHFSHMRVCEVPRDMNRIWWKLPSNTPYDTHPLTYN